MRSRAFTLLALGAAAKSAPWLVTRRPVRNRMLPHVSGVGEHTHVAITFDDGPDRWSTPQFLAELDRLGWKATFFMLGSMVDRDRKLAAEVAAEGHEVGVHGYVHASHLRRSPRAIREDVQRAKDVIADATGVAPRWFRPPYGTVAWGTSQAARRADLDLVLWTTWGRDWRRRATSATVTADVSRTLTPGATVLLHDSDCTSAPDSWRAALGALAPLSELFQSCELRPGPLSDHGVVARRLRPG